ncbi:dnaJ homolog subfamily C member 21 isoform X2 [Tachypleus tridentatus]|uniref:dnaJ homolog subfamily C member 21 isoform X2 n=1 Tax=Tachypleus tridentatus TaxID=6853 RepID=UPI003FD1E308
MRCYYEILGVSRDVSSEDLKKAYRLLALQWHPDKNLHRLQEATQQFQLIQQAYEVLIDPQERAWYDRHREAILKGGLGEYKDDSVDIFFYFNASCYVGYGDDEKGFYTVYRDLFDKIAVMEKMFMEDIEIPSFGNSESSYEEVVHLFYAYWQSFCTAKSFTWLDKYDIREAPNRRVLRLMEKENKKIRDQAKKRLNEEVRQLVAFVRRRDRRVQAYRKKLEQKAAENFKKSEEQRRKQILERQRDLANFQESEWSSMSVLEKELKEMEAHLDQQFGQTEDSGEDPDKSDDSGEELGLFCIACDKAFKSDKALRNHEKSKRHRENVLLLKTAMEEDDEELEQLLNNDFVLDYEDETEVTEITTSTSKKKKKKKQKRATVDNQDEEDVKEDVDVLTEDVSLKTEFLNQPPKDTETNTSDDYYHVSSDDNLKDIQMNITDLDCQATMDKNTRNKHLSNKTKKKKKVDVKSVTSESTSKQSSTKCSMCGSEFLSRNKLFSHLKETGHSVYIPLQEVDKAESTKGTKGKK